MKIRPVGAEVLHTNWQTEGRTDRQINRHDKTNNRFSQLCERAYNICDVNREYMLRRLPGK